jgi:hypothetical protein
MTRNETRLRIMSQATEDVTGLWELTATPHSPAIDDVIDVLSTLIRDGLVAVYRGTQFASEETLLPAPAARKEIRNRNFWDWSAAESGPHLRVFATPRGRGWYFAQGKPPADTRLVS